PRCDRVEQLADDVAALHVAEDETPRVQRLAVGFAGRKTALRDRDEPLDERPQFLRARHGDFEPLVAQQLGGLVAKHRDAVLRHPAEFSMTGSMTHDCLFAAGTRRCYSADCAAPWSSLMPRLRPMVARISFISFRDLRPKFFVFSISPSVFCTSSRIVRIFA